MNIILRSLCCLRNLCNGVFKMYCISQFGETSPQRGVNIKPLPLHSVFVPQIEFTVSWFIGPCYDFPLQVCHFFHSVFIYSQHHWALQSLCCQATWQTLFTAQIVYQSDINLLLFGYCAIHTYTHSRTHTFMVKMKLDWSLSSLPVSHQTKACKIRQHCWDYMEL